MFIYIFLFIYASQQSINKRVHLFFIVNDIQAIFILSNLFIPVYYYYYVKKQKLYILHLFFTILTYIQNALYLEDRKKSIIILGIVESFKFAIL